MPVAEAQEEKTSIQPEVDKAPEIKQKQSPKIDTLHIEGTLIKIYETGISEKTRVLVNVAGEEIEFNAPTDNNKASLQAATKKKVQVAYYDKVNFIEFDITIDGATIHVESEFEPTEDAHYT